MKKSSNTRNNYNVSNGKHSKTASCYVALAEPITLYRQTLMHSLFQYNNIKVIAESPCVHALLQKVETECAHVLIAGIEINTPTCFEILQTISAKRANAKLIIHGSIDDKLLIEHLLRFGLYGFVSKYASLEVLVEAIKGHKQFAHYYKPSKPENQTSNTLPEINSKFNKLSTREMSIVYMICNGKNTPEIASELGLSKRTVEKIRENIYAKTQLHSICELIKYAIKNKLYCPYTNMPIKR